MFIPAQAADGENSAAVLELERPFESSHLGIKYQTAGQVNYTEISSFPHCAELGDILDASRHR